MSFDCDATWISPKYVVASGGRFMTVREVAERYGVTQRTVRSAMERGELTRYRCGRLIYVDWQEVQNRRDAHETVTRYVNGREVLDTRPIAWHTLRDTHPSGKPRRNRGRRQAVKET